MFVFNEQPINLKMMRELGANGEGSPGNLQQFIDEVGVWLAFFTCRIFY